MFKKILFFSFSRMQMTWTLGCSTCFVSFRAKTLGTTRPVHSLSSKNIRFVFVLFCSSAWTLLPVCHKPLRFVTKLTNWLIVLSLCRDFENSCLVLKVLIVSFKLFDTFFLAYNGRVAELQVGHWQPARTSRQSWREGQVLNFIPVLQEFRI